MYSTDHDIRSCVVRAFKEYSPAWTIRHEIPLDTASSGGRMDMLLLHPNFGICGLELKSGRDGLSRLEQQRMGNQLACDFAGEILDIAHTRNVAYSYGKIFYSQAHDALVHSVRGEWLPLNEGMFPTPLHTVFRYRSENTSVVAMVRLLWREEALRMARELDLPVKQKTRSAVERYAQEHLSLNVVRPFVMDALKNRVLNKYEISFYKRFEAETGSEKCSQNSR